MSTIIFAAGAKGGTGKSTAICLLTNFLRKQGLKPLLLDMDNENRTLSRFFPEAEQVKLDIIDIDGEYSHDEYSNDVLINKALEGEKLVVADLKAGTGRGTLDWWSKLPFSRLSHIRFICLASINNSPDSVQSFFNWANTLQNRVAYIVCKNKRDGVICADYDESFEGIRFHETTEKLYEVIIPDFKRYMTELERLNLTVTEVLDSLDADANADKTPAGKEISLELKNLLVRARLEDFQNKIFSQFQPVLNILNE
jgi:hypothetical protein